MLIEDRNNLCERAQNEQNISLNQEEFEYLKKIVAKSRLLANRNRMSAVRTGGTYTMQGNIEKLDKLLKKFENIQNECLLIR